MEKVTVLNFSENGSEAPKSAKGDVIFGSGGGGSGMDKEYLDARLEAVKAQNDARFAEVRASLDTILAQVSVVSNKVDDKPSLTWLIGIAVAGFLAVLAVLSFGGDRFDGGVSVQTAVSERTLQAERLSRENAEQIKAILDLIQANQ